MESNKKFKSCKISASLLAADFSNLHKEIIEIEISKANELHFDVMDGHFVPNISMGLPILESVRPLINKPIDIHMMVSNPDNHIKVFNEAGGDIFTFHIEASKDPIKTIERIKETKMLAGVSIKPDTSYKEISGLINIVDRILVMTVEPGLGGQKFIPEMLGKIKKISEMINSNGKSIDLAVDGGIKSDTAKSVVKYGVSTLIAGTGIFQNKKGIVGGVEELISSLY
ncbi:MAG: ribulose-phosphate 3-epimerase [Chloroflexi bacterium]|nr:ribulose-phosphate 3-epimerase [Chloroflexota bacterium]